MSKRFTEKAEAALNRSTEIAEGFGHTYIGSEHILLALCEDDYAYLSSDHTPILADITL